MGEQLEHKVDRTGWAPGPWDNEPDKKEWRYHGAPCLAVRNQFGAWCGYVAVSPKHPLWETPYGAKTWKLHHPWRRKMREPIRGDYFYTIPRMLGAMSGHLEASPDVVFDVHGGITFANHCSGPICHIPAEGESDNVWWFGFDCGHNGDLSPQMEALMRDHRSKRGYVSDDVYRDLEWVTKETEQFADQLIALTRPYYRPTNTRHRNRPYGWKSMGFVRREVQRFKRQHQELFTA